jgi:hypothetical protein
VSLPLGYDVCAGYNSAHLTTVFAGSTYLPYKMGKKDYLAIETPVYPGGVDTGQRPSPRQSVLGLVGMTTLPSFVLTKALEDHPGTAVAFHYGSGSSKVTFRQARRQPERNRRRSISTTDGTSRPSRWWTDPECSETQTRWPCCWGIRRSACCWER